MAVSAMLFNICSEQIFELGVADTEDRIRVNGGTFVNSIKLTEDAAVMIANSRDELTRLIYNLQKRANEFEMNINFDNAKYL